MMSLLNCVLVSYCLTITSAIRVDWNTNTGPIIPATHTTIHRPIPPYREPAQVWEDISTDIPNPNPYTYIAPPPSRPKQRLHTKVDYSKINHNRNNNYGIVIQPSNNINAAGKATATATATAIVAAQAKATSAITVNSLSSKYIPNVGRKYAAVISKTYNNNNNYKNYNDNSNDNNDDIESPLYKWQGKYNVKAKKYKAYETIKYKPQNYYGKLQYKIDTNIKVDDGNQHKNQDDNNRNDHGKFQAAYNTFDLPQNNGEWLQATKNDEKLQQQQQHRRQQQQQLQQWQQQQRQQQQHEYHQYQQLPHKTDKFVWKSKKFAKYNNKARSNEKIPMENTLKVITAGITKPLANGEAIETFTLPTTTAATATTTTSIAIGTDSEIENVTTTATATSISTSTEELSSRLLKKLAYYNETPLSYKSKKYFTKSMWDIK